MKDTFSKMHPITNLVFFAAVILFSMFYMHPICLIFSLFGAFANAVILSGKKAVLFSLRFLLPTALMLIIINPLFNHRGKTIICYLPWDNPLTLESIIYGFAAAALVCAVALWFHAFNRVMTSDKLIYLFGRIAPALGLVLSMALRFIPTLIEETDKIMSAQKARGADFETGNLIERAKALLPILVPLFVSAFRRADELAVAMESRCYHGGEGRTRMKQLRFCTRDFIALILGAVFTAAVFVMKHFGL